ncbi:extracellular solute-binding protein [Maledivibacter halophilus]|uniref:Signal transducer regulating beta-lactamase production, contains metallopeptidase domain n=1 Tax=Maledivibacter halophilus TaxID=36842 RepID=A0A1T5ILQ5_9FIRM|nr:extracellular solute-binding protein [Maledivibacter halophilus]SKC40134.1 Signal transducer regulating beta-lactamase production, contains metallopeptidase domain [Maledivibacter halophilus]
MTLYSMFYTILTMSFMGSITALVILFFKKIFKKRISPNWHYLIWIILLIRLIIPYAPESSLSIFNFFTHYNEEIQEIQSPIIQDKNYNSLNSNDIETLIDSTSYDFLKSKDLEHKSFKTDSSKGHNKNQYFYENRLYIFNMIKSQHADLPIKFVKYSQKLKIDFFHILGIIWLVGVFISSTYIIWVQLSYSLKIRSLHHCTNKSILSNYYNCKSQMKVRKKIPLIVDYQIKAPSLIGILNPKILISPYYIDLLTNEELRFVFMHELAHYKRKDIIIRWVLIFLQILHWFNPVLWFAFYKIRQDCETACDSYVLSYINEYEYKKYGSTMVKMLDIFSSSNYIPGAAGMLNHKKFIVERVKNIMNFKKNYIVWSLFGIALFAVLTAFLLTNGKDPSKEVIKIKYDAEEIGKNLGLESITDLKSISNGQFLIQDTKNNQFIIINSDGSKERIIDCKDLPKDTKKIFTVDSKNQLYVLSAASTLKIDIYDLMGKKINEIELKDADIAKTDYVYDWDLEVDTNDNIYVLIPDTNIQVFDTKGSKVKTINENGCSFIELDENDDLYIGGYNKNDYVLKLNPLEENVLWKFEDEQNLISIKSASYSKQSKSLYVAIKDKIITIDSDGKSMNPVLHIDSIIQENGSFVGLNFSIGQNENIYLCGFNRDNRNKGLVYKISTSKSIINSEDIKHLTISVRNLDSTLEYAINKFENMHPNIVINVEDYSAFSWIKGDMTYEDTSKIEEEAFQKEYDFIQKINTQMLTGKGPDIIQMDNIPYKKYADKGLLLDLKEMMNKDTSFDRNLYYSNIFDAMEYKDGLYIMPLTVTYPALLSNTNFLKEYSIEFDDNSWAWKDFLDISKKVTMDIDGDGKNDMYSMPTTFPKDIFKFLLSSTNHSFIDYENKEAHFASKEFIELLKLCETMCNEEFMNPEVTHFDSHNGGFVFFPWPVNDFSLFTANVLINADEITFYKYPTSNRDIYPFTVYNMYGINSNTKYKNEAWEFVKFLLSEEVQEYTKLYDTPINKNAREKKFEYNLKRANTDMEESGSLYGYKVTSPKEINKRLKYNIEKMNKLVPKLNTFNAYDIQIQKILKEETKSFFDGNKSAKETSQIIQRKVEMYLNE